MEDNTNTTATPVEEQNTVAEPAESVEMVEDVSEDVETEPVVDEMSAEERAQADEDQKNAGIIRDKCQKFFNEELKTLDMPLLLVDNVVKNVLGAMFKIHQAKAKSFQDFLAAKKKVEEEVMNYVEQATE